MVSHYRLFHAVIILLPEDEQKEYYRTYEVGNYMIEVVIRDGELTAILRVLKFKPLTQLNLRFQKSHFIFVLIEMKQVK